MSQKLSQGLSNQSGLHATVAFRRDDFSLDAEITARPGEIVGILGPNGAGKTSLLNAIAGITPIAAGRISLDATVLDDPKAGCFVPPCARPVGVVFQDYRLFPHLSVADNVAFGLRSRGTARAPAQRVAMTWLERVGVAHLAGQKPRALSGGQAQRVALARALATSPRLLLLDEPLSAVDVASRVDLRRALRRQLAEFCGARLLVTHDPVEALALTDRLIVLEHGRVIQTGSPAEISRRPRSPYVAALVGLNLYRGQARMNGIDLDDGGHLAATTDDRTGAVFALVHPRAVSLYRQRPAGTPRNVWRGTAGELEAVGERVRVHVDGQVPIVAEVTPAAIAELKLGAGGSVWVSVKATEVDVYMV